MKHILEICIPAYRRPQELRNCLQSIISQKEFSQNWVSIRIFDDAPHDPSRKSIQDILKKYPKQIFYRKNKINLGFEKNIAELLESGASIYCLVITDDDEMSHQSLKKLYSLLTSKERYAVLRSAFAMRIGKKVTKTHKLFLKNKEITPTEHEYISKMFRDSDALSGTCFLRSALDMKGYRRHIGTMYPHMYLVGNSSFVGNSYYISDPIIYHTVGNQVFWEYSKDYMISGIISMVVDLGKKYPGFFKPAAQLVFSTVPYILYINISHPKRLYDFISSMVNKKYVFMSEFWVGVVTGIIDVLRAKFAR